MSTSRVILLHGQPGSPLAWLPTIAELRRMAPGLAVRAPDRPGYGDNPRPAGDFTANAEWLAAVVGPGESVVVVGHSWAAGAAMATAALIPDRVRGVVLAAPVGPDCLRWFDRPLAAPVLGTLVGWGMRCFAPAMWWLLQRRLRRHGAAVPDDVRRSDPRVGSSFVFEQRALIDGMPDLGRFAAAIRAPTMIVTGSADSMIPRRTVDALVALIPDVRLRVIEGAGHDLPLAEPGALAAAIVTLLRETG